MDERELIRLAQGGDYDAFSKLVQKYEKQLFAIAKRMTRNRQDAEDILQETFLKAIDKIDKFRGESSFGTWLYSIALNQGRAHLQKEKRSEIKSIDDLLPVRGHESNGNTALSDWKDPHTLMESAQIRDYIENAIDELRAEYSIPFILRYHEEMSIKEIADIMKLSEAAVKSRILRARLFLRDKLDLILKIETPK